MEVTSLMISASMLGHRMPQKKVGSILGAAEKRFVFQILVSASSECRVPDKGLMQNRMVKYYSGCRFVT
jgi:hypothetical protein